jgi:hypothetical protein
VNLSHQLWQETAFGTKDCTGGSRVHCGHETGRKKNREMAATQRPGGHTYMPGAQSGICLRHSLCPGRAREHRLHVTRNPAAQAGGGSLLQEHAHASFGETGNTLRSCHSRSKAQTGGRHYPVQGKQGSPGSFKHWATGLRKRKRENG